MDPTVKVAIITTAGVVLSALIAFLGVRATQRQVANATQTQAATEAKKTDLEKQKLEAETRRQETAAFERIQKMYQGALDELEDQIADCRKALREQQEQHRVDLQELQNRINTLELRRDADTLQIRLLQSYVRRLLSVIRGAQMIAPDPPEGLVLEHID